MKPEIVPIKDTVKAVLTNEVKYIIAIIVFIFGVISPFYQLREDIALIQKDISIINTNHEAHIQDLTQQIKENTESIKENREAILVIISSKK